MHLSFYRVCLITFLPHSVNSLCEEGTKYRSSVSRRNSRV